MRFMPAVFLLSLSPPVFAISVCYESASYPFAAHPEMTDAGLTFLTQPVDGAAQRSERVTLVRMTGNAAGFRATGTEECSFWGCPQLMEPDRCPDGMPEIHVDNDQLPDHRREVYASTPLAQKPGACVAVGDDVYFGLEFEAGEGAMGAGGIGRWNRVTGELELRHPDRLKPVSVNHIAFDGKRLWLGTYENAECSGQIPASRVQVYDWQENRFEGGKQQVPNLFTCGFVVRGFALESPQHMWVASDLGITRVRIVEDHAWAGVGFSSEHWWAERTPDGIVMRQGECEEEYDHLLMTLSLEDIPTHVSPLHQFGHSLLQYNRHYVFRHFLEKVHADRDLTAFAVAIRDSGGDSASGQRLQDCETGELYRPRGSAWEGMLRKYRPEVTSPGTPARRAWHVVGRVIPSPGTGTAVLDVHGTGRATDAFGHCATAGEVRGGQDGQHGVTAPAG